MKVTTLPIVYRALDRLEHRITVDPAIAARARKAIERMVSIGGGVPVTPTADPGE
jgi:quinolinate synthase